MDFWFFNYILGAPPTRTTMDVQFRADGGIDYGVPNRTAFAGFDFGDRALRMRWLEDVRCRVGTGAAAACAGLET